MPIFLKRYGLVLSMYETEVSALFNLERSVFILFQWHDETMFQYFSLFNIISSQPLKKIKVQVQEEGFYQGLSEMER